jgi:hypothetical protein
MKPVARALLWFAFETGEPRKTFLERSMKIFNRTNRIVLGLITAAGFQAWSTSAHAETFCGSTAAGWNVPNGAAVFEHSGGFITGMMNAIGEYRTHSMLSRGPNGWVTHATASKPGTQNECSLPIDTSFLRASTPGLATIDQGAAYTFLYNNGGAPAFLAYQRAATVHVPDFTGGHNLDYGPIIGNQFLGSTWGGDYLTWHQMGSGSNTVWGTDWTQMSSNGVFFGKGQVYYGWNQYMNIGGTAQGILGGNQEGYGVVCSTSLAMWQHESKFGDMKPRTYNSTVITAAANALWDEVYNACKGTTTIDGWNNWSGALAALTCFGQSVCGNAADELLNTFANDNSESNQYGDWYNTVTHNNAVSISPDDVGCWNSNGTGPGCTGTGASVWGWDVNNNVQWNSGGNSYGCWAQ